MTFDSLFFAFCAGAAFINVRDSATNAERVEWATLSVIYLGIALVLRAAQRRGAR